MAFDVTEDHKDLHNQGVELWKRSESVEGEAAKTLRLEAIRKFELAEERKPDFYRMR